jgi:hypothetical protein
MQKPVSSPSTTKPWIGVNFVCAGAYRRVFRDNNATEYQARCPKCSQCVRFRVEPGGSNERFYEVTCDGNWPT